MQGDRGPDLIVCGLDPVPRRHDATPNGVGRASGLARDGRRCPSGALHYRLAAGPAEDADVPTTVTVIEGGPILLRGDLELRGSFPAVRDTRMALCVCTRSARLPFCDAACTNPAA